MLLPISKVERTFRCNVNSNARPRATQHKNGVRDKDSGHDDGVQLRCCLTTETPAEGLLTERTEASLYTGRSEEHKREPGKGWQRRVLDRCQHLSTEDFACWFTERCREQHLEVHHIAHAGSNCPVPKSKVRPVRRPIPGTDRVKPTAKPERCQTQDVVRHGSAMLVPNLRVVNTISENSLPA